MDGEHYPPVVRAAIDQLSSRLAGAVPCGAALLGGREKLPDDALPDLDGLTVVTGPTPEDALVEGLVRFAPDAVFDLSDEPVLDARRRLGLVARTLLAGVPYVGADFRFDPPPRPRVATKPTVAVIGTGKRTGKTAVTGAIARLLAARGSPPVVVAMGRGGPAEPELVEPGRFDLSVAGLLALADAGRHAASDHLEDALMAGVATIGTRRCGGGMAGAPAYATFVEGVVLANGRPESILLLEGSGRAIPPVHADATVCVVRADSDPELVSGYLGAYRVLLADLVVTTMGDESFADSGARASTGDLHRLERSVRGLAPGVPVVHTVLRPFPLEPISGRRVVFVTTAPVSARGVLVGHLEAEHDCTVVGVSHHLAHRSELAADLEAATQADVCLVELKAAAIDLAARTALERGMEVVFCDNRVHSIGGDGSFEALTLATADLAGSRHQQTMRPISTPPATSHQ
ncbi:MAG: 2,3-diphosphoglycerate synthetase [Acidimicrobiales bacterium]